MRNVQYTLHIAVNGLWIDRRRMALSDEEGSLGRLNGRKA
jgi:hypothetical protein